MKRIVFLLVGMLFCSQVALAGGSQPSRGEKLRYFENPNLPLQNSFNERLLFSLTYRFRYQFRDESRGSNDWDNKRFSTSLNKLLERSERPFRIEINRKFQKGGCLIGNESFGRVFDDWIQLGDPKVVNSWDGKFNTEAKVIWFDYITHLNSNGCADEVANLNKLLAFKQYFEGTFAWDYAQALKKAIYEPTPGSLNAVIMYDLSELELVDEDSLRHHERVVTALKSALESMTTDNLVWYQRFPFDVAKWGRCHGPQSKPGSIS